MIFVRLFPVIFSMMLFAAHFLRFSGLPTATVSLLLLLTLFIRRPWVLRFWQVVMLFATLMWIDTTFNLVHQRVEMGTPWGRLAIIMGVVIAFTVFSGIWLENKKIKSFYHKESSDSE